MHKNVLLAFSRQDTALREQIEEESLYKLVDLEGREVSIHAERNQSEALSRLAWFASTQGAQELDFAIVGQGLARDRVSAVEETGGIELCEQLRARGLDAPILLLVPHVTQLTNDLLTRSAAARVTALSTDGEVLALVRKLVSNYRPPARVLDIMLSLDANSEWDYSLIGTNFRFFRNGHLKPSPNLLALANAMTLNVEMATQPGTGWYSHFKTLGTALSLGLCDTTKFGAELERGLDLAGGIEHARISFSLGAADRAHFPIALEALFPPPKFPEVPWMVRAPLYRKLSPDMTPGRPLFGPGLPPPNVLLVGADSHGFVNKLVDEEGHSLHLDELRDIGRECVGLQRNFARQGQAGVLGRVELLEPPRGGRITPRRLFEALESNDWTIVHFAGHTKAREAGAKESRGYVFIGGPDRPDPIEIDQLAPLLRRTTMVYLSSCESMSPAFAIELAKHVPVVIGFRWAVDDRFAALHARLFYRYLFEERKVETAFLKTRRAIYRRYSQRERIWASSMLVFGRAA